MPPETMRKPSPASAVAKALALRTIWAAYSRELGLRRLVERHRFGRDDVFEGAALQAREDGLVDRLRQGLRGKDATPTGSPEGLVGGEGDDVRERDRVGVGAPRYQAGNVGGIEHKQRADGIGDAAQRLGLDDPGVSGRAGHDELGPVLFGQVRQSLVVDPLVAGAHAVADEVVPLRR